MAKTVLRVKRRRDDPSPPEIFELQTKPFVRRKRSRKDADDEAADQVTSMLGNSSLLGTPLLPPVGINDSSSLKAIQQTQTMSNSHGSVQTESSFKVIFRKVEPSSHKRKAHPDEHVKIVDATVDSSLGKHSPFEKINEQNGFDVGRESHMHKRTKFSLRMVETRVVNEQQFWEGQEFQKQSVQLTNNNSTQSQKVIISANMKNGSCNVRRRRSNLRDRMKQRASTTPKTSSRARGSRILDPLSKMIDDSLRSIHQGSNMLYNPTQSILQHIGLLQVQSQSGGLLANLVNWQCTDGSGTILHICALVNSIEGAQAVCHCYPNLLDVWKKDGDGRTAMDVARETEAKGVLDVINAHFHGGELEHGEHDHEDGDADYVYDVYCLDSYHLHQQNANQSATSNQEQQPSRDKEDPQSRIREIQDDSTVADKLASNNSISMTKTQGGLTCDTQDSQSLTQLSSTGNPGGSEPVVVNMYGGVGYWVDGELVLDVHHDGESDDSQMEDDEYDSNREDCDANDYPDEGDSDVCCNSAIDRGTGMTPPRFMNGHTKSTVSDSDDESDYNIDAIDFRNRPIDLDSVPIGGTLHRFGGCNMQDDEDFDSDDGEYRGFMCRNSHSWSNERIYCETEAYDPDLDGEDSQ
jgi:hypothetical protein